MAPESDEAGRLQARRAAMAAGVPAAFDRAADALEQSAELADVHAVRADEQGTPGNGDAEREIAAWAREAARRSRAAAERIRANPPI